jgi:hypothetical protein
MYFVVAASEFRTGQQTQPGKIAGGRVDGFSSCGWRLEGEPEGHRRNFNDVH